MLRNLSRTLLIAGVAWLAAVPALTAQTAAAAAGPIRGDVDGDGRVTAADARIIADFLVGRPVPQGASVAERGDVNGDGKVTSVDAAIVRAYAAGRDVSRFRVGAPVDPGSADNLRIKCVAQVRARTVACTSPSAPAEGARADLVLGNQNVYVKVASSNIVVTDEAATGDLLFAFDVTLKNLLHQALGVDSTGAAAPIDIFFISGPNTTAGVGETTVETGEIGTFTATGQEYYRYEGATLGADNILKTDETSSALNWVLRLDSAVTTFAFELGVNAPVQFNAGWVDVYTDTLTPRPSNPLTVDSAAIAVGQTLQLSDTVRNHLGKTISDASVSWSSSDPAVATVDAAGLVTPVTNGVTFITATSGARTGTAKIIVRPGAPALIEKTAGDEQTGTPGANVAIPPKVTVKDQFGNLVPNATVTFAVTGGGGSVSNGVVSGTSVTVTTSAAGVATLTSWTLGAGPTLNTLEVSAAPGSAPHVVFTAYIPPTALSDSSQAMGNTKLDSLVAPNVLTNDAGTNGLPISLVATGALPTVRGGTVTLAEDGSFTYLPPAGNTARDSVQYTITDTKVQSSAWIKFRFVGKVWYVDSSNGGAADGRDVSPFAGIGAAEAVAGPNDSILVRTGSGVTAGGTLKVGQLVYGAASAAPFTTVLNDTTVTLLAVGSAPSIGALTLGTGAAGNTLRGFTSTGGIAGSGFGTLTVSNIDINNPSGQALNLNNGTLAGSFGHVQSGGGTNNVSLTSVATTGPAILGAAADALTGATGDAIVISGGAGSFTYLGTISNSASLAVNVANKSGGAVSFTGSINPAAAGRGISVTGNTGGTVTFSGAAKKISSATAAGVTLTGNTGATVAFTGGLLTIATSTGTPFTATGGGTVEVSGSGNTISVTGAAARAVNLSGITLAAGGIDFSTISSSGTTTASAFSATNVGGGAFTAGSLTVAGTTGGTSRGLELNSNSAPFTFTTASIGATGAEGIYLNGNTGAVAVNGGSVANTVGDALAVTGGNAAVTVAASLTKTSAGRVANVTSRTGGATTVSGNLSCTASCTGINASSNSGGTLTFSGATQTLSTGANAAATLSSNTGATIDFTGGALVITTAAGAGFNATGGGTVSVTGSANTISSGTGTALTVSSTTIGASGLTFRSISANGGSNGIVLSSTGTNAGLTVTGDGATAASGGTIQNTTGGDGTTAGNGIYLSSTRAVSLAFMQLNGHSNNGVRGIDVVGVTMNKLRFTGSNGSTEAGPYYESAVYFDQLTGSAGITGSYFSGGKGNNFRVSNTSGSLNRITFTSDTFAVEAGNPTTRLLNDALLVQGLGTATVNTTIQSSRFQAAGGDLFQYDLGGTAVGDLVLNNTAFSNSHSNIASGGGGVVIAAGGGGSPTMTYAITNNTFRDALGTALVVSKTSGTGTATGTITGNTIGVSGVDGSGSAQGSGMDIGQVGGGKHTTTITGNTIRQFTNLAGILFQVGNNSVANGGQGRIKAVVQSNSIAQLSSTVASASIVTNGIHVQTGTNSGDNLIACMTIGGAGALANTLNGTGANGGTDIRLRALQSTTLLLPGFAGNATVASERNTFVQGNNAVAPTVSSVTGGSGTYAGGSCPF